MPVGRNHLTGLSEAVTAPLTNAVEQVMRTAGRQLGSGEFDQDPDKARKHLTALAKQARSELRVNLAATFEATIDAWENGAQYLNDDLTAAGVDIGHLTWGEQTVQVGAVGDGRDTTVDRHLRDTAAKLAADLDQAFWQAMRRLTDAVADAVDHPGFTGPALTALRDNTWNRFLDRGPTVTATNGRQFAIDGYARSLAGTHLMQVAVQSYAAAGRQAGVVCVAISTSQGQCPLCSRWEGQLLAFDKASLAKAQASTDVQVRAVKDTLADAVTAGLFHYGCKHEAFAWVEGLTAMPGHDRATADHDSGGDTGRERAIERLIEKWERKAKYATATLDQLRARRHARQWRTKLTELRAERHGFADTPAGDDVVAPVSGDQAESGTLTTSPEQVLVPVLDDGTDTVTQARQKASAAADQFTHHMGLHRFGTVFTLTDFDARENETDLTFTVSGDDGELVGEVTVNVVPGELGGHASLTGVHKFGFPGRTGQVSEAATAFVQTWNDVQVHKNAATADVVATIDVDPAGVLFTGSQPSRTDRAAAESAAADAAWSFTETSHDDLEVIFTSLEVDGSVTYAEFDVIEAASVDQFDPVGGFRVIVDGTSAGAARVAADYAWFDADDNRFRIESVADRFATAWHAAIPPAQLGDDTWPVLARDLFDHADEQAVRAAVVAMFEAQPFDGFTAEVTHVDFSDTLVNIRGQLSAQGRPIGVFGRELQFKPSGLFAYHALLDIDTAAQGQRIADQFNAFLYDWYRVSGVRAVRVYANITVGGYAWARHGYYWDSEDEANMLWRALTSMTRSQSATAERMRARATESGQDPAVTAKLMTFVESVETQVAAAHALLERADNAPFGTRDYPSPYDLSEVGRPPGGGRDLSWIGKQVLLNTHWYGVKWIDESESSTSS